MGLSRHPVEYSRTNPHLGIEPTTVIVEFHESIRAGLTGQLPVRPPLISFLLVPPFPLMVERHFAENDPSRSIFAPIIQSSHWTIAIALQFWDSIQLFVELWPFSVRFQLFMLDFLASLLEGTNLCRLQSVCLRLQYSNSSLGISQLLINCDNSFDFGRPF